MPAKQQKEPANKDEWIARGNELLNGGRPSEALKAFSKALAIDKYDGDALCGKGTALMQLGRFFEA